MKNERSKEVTAAVLACLGIIVLSVVLVYAMKSDTGFGFTQPRIFLTIIFSLIAFFIYFGFFNSHRSPLQNRKYLYMVPFIGVFFYVLGRTLRDNYHNRYSRFGLFFLVLSVLVICLMELSVFTRNKVIDKIKMNFNIKNIIFSLIFSGLVFGICVIVSITTIGGGWKVEVIQRANTQTTNTTTVTTAPIASIPSTTTTPTG